MPGRCPVVGAHIGVVAPGLRKGDLRRGVVYWPSKPVGYEIRRTHLVHKLLVDGPAAFVGKALGFDQKGGR